MLIQMHLLQSYAPANLNRDDTGSPKDAVFGGVRRGRISSQCLKRSMRRSAVFEEEFRKDGLLGIRTKLLPDLIARELEGMGVDEQARRAIVARLAEVGRESTKSKTEEESLLANGRGEAETEPESETKQLIFLGQDELRPLAERLLAAYRQHGPGQWAKAKIFDITKALGSSLPRSVDIAMFGRMTTSSAFEDVQAAVQVAHALSTHALVQEFDYYTAVDDISGESGAGMIGDVEFNSCVYYKYLNVHWEGLVRNLGGDTSVASRAVAALLEAAATAQPTGKQNSFASHCLPDFVLVEVSERNLPVSYANAFLKPARATGDESLMDASRRQLGDYLQRLSRRYGLQGKRAFLSTEDCQIEGAEGKDGLVELQNWLVEQLPR